MLRSHSRAAKSVALPGARHADAPAADAAGSARSGLPYTLNTRRSTVGARITSSAPASDAAIGASAAATLNCASPAIMALIIVLLPGMYSSVTSSPCFAKSPASWATQAGSCVTLSAT